MEARRGVYDQERFLGQLSIPAARLLYPDIALGAVQDVVEGGTLLLQLPQLPGRLPDFSFPLFHLQEATSEARGSLLSSTEML